jgi:hypothetical protein
VVGGWWSVVGMLNVMRGNVSLVYMSLSDILAERMVVVNWGRSQAFWYFGDGWRFG